MLNAMSKGRARVHAMQGGLSFWGHMDITEVGNQHRASLLKSIRTQKLLFLSALIIKERYVSFPPKERCIGLLFFEKFERRRLETTGTEINVVIGGAGPPVLLLHGYPQSHVMWHKMAPMFANSHTVIATDLRGYGESGKPPGGIDHAGFSKRASAEDQIQVMKQLGYDDFCLVGHDRGARVGHRLALDYPGAVRKFVSLDVIPTTQIFTSVDRATAEAYFHWFLMLQPEPLAETLIGNSPDFYLRWLLDRWSSTPGAILEEVYQEYLKSFTQPGAIHSMCEDYRAVNVDMRHDIEDGDKKIECPVLALWGSGQSQHPGWPSMHLDVVKEWKKCAHDVRGWGIDCGHFMPEEAPEATFAAIIDFLA